MGRPISERIQDPKWWGDQGAHVAAGVVVCGGVAAALGYGAELHLAICAVAGFLVSGVGAVAYEAVQNWGDRPEVGSQMDSILDLGAFWLGASLGPLVLLGV